MPQQGVMHIAFTYNVLISACEKGKQPEPALEVIAAVEQQGMATQAITYNSLIEPLEALAPVR